MVSMLAFKYKGPSSNAVHVIVLGKFKQMNKKRV